MFRQMYLDWGRQKMGLEFVDFMETQIEVGNIAQHFYNEGPELMVRLEVTEKGMQAIVESWATMN